MTRVQQYGAIASAIATTVTLLIAGYNWEQGRGVKRKEESRDVITRQEAPHRLGINLANGDVFERVKTIEEMTLGANEDSSLLRNYYPDVLSFVADHTHPGAATSCGSAVSKREADSVQATADFTRALKFLRRFGPTSRALRDSPSPVDLARANLAGMDLSHADLRGVVFKGACLDHATLDGAALDSALFSDASLRHAMMRELRGAGVVLNNANLDSTRFDGATLVNASFVNANLAHAWFENAILDGADFSGAKLGWSYWRSAQLTGSQHWSEVDTASVAGALLYQASGIEAADLKRLRGLGACVDSIAFGDWDTRMTTPQARDTLCGKPRRSPGL